MRQLYSRLTNDQLVELWLEELRAAEPDDMLHTQNGLKPTAPSSEGQPLADVIDLHEFKEKRAEKALLRRSV